MGKQNNNFEYYKPQSGNLLMASASDSDDGKDSDSKQMFTLPKRKFIRSKGSRSNRGCCFCCKEVCGAIVPLVIAVFILTTLASIGYIMLGVNGMKREIALLKIQLNKVKSDGQSDLLESQSLKSEVKDQLALMGKNEREIQTLKGQVKSLSSQLYLLNATVAKLKDAKHAPKMVASVGNDIKLLQKGMADTGGEIKKLSDENEGTKKAITVLSKIAKSLKTDLSKLSKSVSTWDRSPLPTDAPDTLEPLVVTTSPVDKSSINKESLLKVTKLVRGIVDGYSELFNNKSSHLNEELETLKTHLKAVNSTHSFNIITIEHNIAALANASNVHRERINTLAKLLESGPVQKVNVSSEAKVLGIVKDILVDLKKHQLMISNLTRRIERVEETKIDVDSKQSEEAVAVTTEAPRAEDTTTTILTTTTTTTLLGNTTTAEAKAPDLISTTSPEWAPNPSGSSEKPASPHPGLAPQPAATSNASVSRRPPVTTDANLVSTQSQSSKKVINGADTNNTTNNVTNIDLTVPKTTIAPESQTTVPVKTASTSKTVLHTTGASMAREDVADEEPLGDSRPHAAFKKKKKRLFGRKREMEQRRRERFPDDDGMDFGPENEKIGPTEELSDEDLSNRSKGVKPGDAQKRFDALDSLDDAA